MSRRRHEALEEALRERRILIVCGSGGVGKTTVAAALGLEAARAGRRVLVCTIDPSRRLATSLGLSRLEAKPRKLDIERLRLPRAPGGSLFAMHLDTKRTFDALVARYAKDDAARDRILKNRFYAQVSSALAGSQEYMAMEKLLDLSKDDRFDLIVLDTPPTRHALDFLEAPEKLLGFLDTSVLRWFLKPYFAAGRLTIKVATRTGAIVMKIVDKAIGLQFLADLSEFFLAFDGMYDGFKERAGQVVEILKNQGSGFVVVAGPAPQPIGEALYFHARLIKKKMPFVSFIVNRVHVDPAGWATNRGSIGRAPAIPDGLAGRLKEVYEDHRRLSRSERRGIGRLEVDAGGPVVLVAERDADVHDLRALAEIGAAIFDRQDAPKSNGSKR